MEQEKMAIMMTADREGNEKLRDIYYKCPLCGSSYDDYEQAIECLHDCAEEEYGLPQQYEKTLEDE